MDLAYVFGVAFGLALLVGLIVRKAMERKEATERALAIYIADPDRGYPPVNPPPGCVGTFSKRTGMPDPLPDLPDSAYPEGAVKLPK